MIKQLKIFNTNKTFILAYSGGVDSSAIADFYSRGRKTFILAHFNHGTMQANSMQDFCESFARDKNIPIIYNKLSESKPKDLSWEEFWRNQRYSWLNSFDMPVVTAHHLDDAIETWIFSSLHGLSRLPKIKIKNVVRPFILNAKQEFINWCSNKNVKYINDQSNFDISFPRNRIRHIIVPECLKINPGLRKVIRRKLTELIVPLT